MILPYSGVLTKDTTAHSVEENGGTFMTHAMVKELSIVQIAG